MSEVLGNVIMVALTVSMLGAFGTLVLTSVMSDTPVAPAASFTMEPVVGATSIDVRLVSGSSLDLDLTSLSLAVDGAHELGNAAVLSPARAGEWGVGETLRIDLLTGTLAAGQKVGFFAADKNAGKAIGAAYADVPAGTTGTAILRNALTLDLGFDRAPLVADGLMLVNATLEVTSTHGLLLIDHVSLNLTPVGGSADLRLYDDGNYPDADAGDGIFTAPFAVAEHAFTSLPGYANITLEASVVDVLGTTTATSGVLFLTTPTPGKVGAGVVYRAIGSSGAVSEEGYVNLSSFAFRDASATDSDQVELRVSDLDDSTKVWSALVSFAHAGCSGPAVTSIVLRVDGVDGNVTYTPASGCFPIDADAKLNLANVPTSLDASGNEASWNAVATANPEAAFQYAAAGVGDENEALISFFGDTVSSSPFARGLSQTDFSWAPPTGSGPATAPIAITTLAATPANGAVDLAWTAPSTGGSAITGYRIYRDGTLIATIAPGTSYQATGLTNGQSYAFVVRAVNVIGEAPASNTATATPRALPSAPTGLGGVAGNGTVTLSWSALSGAATGGSGITQYHVYGSTTSGATTYLATTGGPNTTFVVNGLTNGETWFFNVTGHNAAGQGSSSVQTSVTPSAIPYPPDALGATAGDARVTLTWTPGDHGGLALTDHFIHRGTASGATALLAATGSGANTSFVDLTAQNGVTYFYHVTTRNANGESAASNEASATPAAVTTAPSAPLAAEAESRNGTLRLTWTAPATDGSSAITNYRIYVGTTSGSLTFLAGTGGSNRTFDVNGLANGQLTFFQVSAVNAIGEGPRSAEASATPLAVPYPPSGLAAARGDQSAALTWNAPANTGGAPITGYHVHAGTASGSLTYLGATGSATPGYTVTGLTNGVAYVFHVTAENAAGLSAASNEASVVPATVPDAPASLSASPSDGSVTLTWTPSAHGGSALTDHRIYVGTVSGSTTLFASTGSGSNTSFVANGLPNGVPHFFTVVAVNAVGASSGSNEATATPAGLPSAPQALAAAKGNGTVSLTWSAPASTGGSPITAYHVYRGTTSGAATYLATTTSLSYVATGLTNGQAYHFNVTAANAVGQGASSSEASATPSAIPYPPASLAASAGNGYATLTWSAPSSNGGSAITGYNVYRGTALGAATFLVATGTTATTYNATGLTNGITYFFNVTAVNANGQSATSNSASATPATVPGAPTGLAAVKGNGTVTLTWTAPASNGGSALTGYRIYMDTTSGASTLLASGGTNTTFVANGLTNGQTYFFRVTAANAQGQGAFSAEASATPSTVPLPPTGLAAAASNGTATLTWNAPASNGGSAITGYNVYRGTVGGATTFLASTGSTSTTYAATGLTNGVAYFFNVTAVNANGQSATSNQASVTPIGVPFPPATLTATGGAGRIDLSWSAGSTGGSAITGYQIWRGTASGGETLLAIIGTNTTYADLSVTPGTTYYYQIRAVNAAGTSSPSVERSASATSTATPSAPANLLLVPGNARVNVSWSAPASGAPITSYHVYRSTTNSTGSMTLIATVAGGVTTYSDTGRTNGTTYYYHVTARNANGEGAGTAIKDATPNGFRGVDCTPGAYTQTAGETLSPSCIPLLTEDSTTTEFREPGGNNKEFDVTFTINTTGLVGAYRLEFRGYRENSNEAISMYALNQTSGAYDLIGTILGSQTTMATHGATVYSQHHWANGALTIRFKDPGPDNGLSSWEIDHVGLVTP